MKQLNSGYAGPIAIRPVLGFEGYYSVSADGRVYSEARTVRGLSKSGNECFRNRPGRWLRPLISSNGYIQASLSMKGMQYKVLLHRLVARAFVSGHFEGAEVNHLDWDIQHNDSWNLEWTTPSANIKHAHMNPKRKVKTR